MAQMNKRPADVPRRQELEKELIGEIESQKALVETGTDKVADGNKFHRDANRNYKGFAIKQGVRRRHPDRVLAQFAAIVDQTSNAQSAWEKALMHEQQRVEVPEEYKAKDAEMISNQVGLVTTALDNFAKSKSKFERVYSMG